jgi:hypothetical protein
LFSATEDDALEARIEEKGREIEEHADQLQATIADLERREARTAHLRTAVEEMLRQGSAELDERHASLTELSLDLASREEGVRAAERDIAVRKQELGAVELLRAAVERREAEVARREAEVERIASDLALHEREGSEPREQAQTDPAPFDGTVLILSGISSYRMIDGPEAVLPVGAAITIEGSEHIVVRIGRSPLTDDRRCWTYVEPA